MIKAVIDTNVIVSAYITKNLEAATSKVWEAVLQNKLTPIYNEEILNEYSEVLHREKFGIPEHLIKWALDKIVTNGVRGERILSDEFLPDPKDAGNNCTVSYNQSTPTNTVVDTLKATVSRNGNTLTILSKEIYVHGTNLNIVGSQVTSSMSGQLVQNEFAINTSTAVNNTIYADSISLVGDCEITMTSERFKGMDISFSGAVQPTDYQRTGNTITFTPPTSINEYYMTLAVESSCGCSDFDVVFTISSDDNAQLSSFFLALSLDQSQLYLTLQDAAGTPWQQGTWNFTITNVITGQQVHSQQVVGPSATVNISSYASGLYVVNATYDGARYSKKFVKN